MLPSTQTTQACTRKLRKKNSHVCLVHFPTLLQIIEIMFLEAPTFSRFEEASDRTHLSTTEKCIGNTRHLHNALKRNSRILNISQVPVMCRELCWD